MLALLGGKAKSGQNHPTIFTSKFAHCYLLLTHLGYGTECRWHGPCWRVGPKIYLCQNAAQTCLPHHSVPPFHKPREFLSTPYQAEAIQEVHKRFLTENRLKIPVLNQCVMDDKIRYFEASITTLIYKLYFQNEIIVWMFCYSNVIIQFKC